MDIDRIDRLREHPECHIMDQTINSYGVALKEFIYFPLYDNKWIYF